MHSRSLFDSLDPRSPHLLALTPVLLPLCRERILSDFRAWAVSQGVEETREALWKAFIGRVGGWM